MAPPSALQQPPLSSDFQAPYPIQRSSTTPAVLQSPRADPSHLAPEDAFYSSPPRRFPSYENGHSSVSEPRRRSRHKDGLENRSRTRRSRKTWKKLLWVKQSNPDNYTDQATFLESLQRNPRLQPYDFWPLVADSTVIVQQVCSVIIFVLCFVGIFQERINFVSVAGWGSMATMLGWLLWDWWVAHDPESDGANSVTRTRSIGGTHHRRQTRERGGVGTGDEKSVNALPTASNSSLSNLPSAASSSSNLLTSQPDLQQRPQLRSVNSASSSNLLRHSHSASASSLLSQTSGNGTSPARGFSQEDVLLSQRHGHSSPLPGSTADARFNTVKSAILIYSTLLGLSPILKSLTRSTSSDSIWAMSFWLLAINIFFFDYSGTWEGVNKLPVASLSTNAALMASTVLASRLPSTGQVFSLTLFSIEVFGLFPVFRRYARHRSWQYHIALTVLLVLGAGAGVGIIVAGPDEKGWPWRSGLLGMLVGCIMAAVAMGGCSWWLIGLQKYKNEIYGPWDPARPIIMSRRHRDDD